MTQRAKRRTITDYGQISPALMRYAERQKLKVLQRLPEGSY